MHFWLIKNKPGTSQIENNKPGTSQIENNKTPAKHRDIFLPFRLHHLSHSYFGRGIGSK